MRAIDRDTFGRMKSALYIKIHDDIACDFGDSISVKSDSYIIDGKHADYWSGDLYDVDCDDCCDRDRKIKDIVAGIDHPVAFAHSRGFHVSREEYDAERFIIFSSNDIRAIIEQLEEIHADTLAFEAAETVSIKTINASNDGEQP